MKRQWQSSTRSVFKDNFGERQISAMCNGEGNVLHSQILGDPFRSGAQTQRWLPARLSYYLDIAPPNAPSPAVPSAFIVASFAAKRPA